MPKHSYAAAKSVITEADKNRIICIYLSCDLSAIDWKKAAADYGSASTESFRKLNQMLLKKIEAASRKPQATNTDIKNKAKITKRKPMSRKKRKVESDSDSDDSEFKFRRRGRQVGQKDENMEEPGIIVDEMEAMNTHDDIDTVAM
ncbi:hypothetical protein DOTSEDRAFT_22803 [Dothistroma septosporum NZE10]|uniref:Uncharacterized protein n=1 Tax=Dothistroma septosporum (strain NZE10 / CBS 128990) TaxID=675120 RepID=N1PUZ6_DOTSN|nr:hypothetical protein DOTSEDRAFT_22803 [Dothistroma septosporum NZE10]